MEQPHAVESPIIIEGSGDPQHGPNLEIEFKRWATVIKIQQLLDWSLNALKKYGKPKYEMNNILERWILSSANFGKGSGDPVFGRGSRVVNDKFISEIVEKNIADKETATSWLKMIISHKNAFIRYARKHPEEKEDLKAITVKIADGIATLKYLNYTKQLTTPRYKLLRGLADDAAILRMCLRYSSILSGSQHWGFSKEIYSELVNKWGVEIEGFASPINSKIIEVDPKRKFCSLFKDTDEVFGSIGSFFEADFLGKTVAVGPPFILDIFVAAADKVIAECERAEELGGKVKFFITFADWNDAEPYQRLKASKYCVHYQVFKKFKHKFVDSNNLDKIIITTFDTALFVLSVGFPKLDYSSVLEKFAAD